MFVNCFILVTLCLLLFYVKFDSLLLQGLSFTFPVPTKYTECFSNRKGIVIYNDLHTVKNTIIFILLSSWLFVAELPLEFPDGTTPITSRISIYDSSTDSKVGVGSLLRKASVPSLPAGSLYMEEVYAKVNITRITIRFLKTLSTS